MVESAAIVLQIIGTVFELKPCFFCAAFETMWNIYSNRIWCYWT